MKYIKKKSIAPNFKIEFEILSQGPKFMVVTCAWISLTCRNKHVNDDEHVTCRCNIFVFVVHNYGCDIL